MRASCVTTTGSPRGAVREARSAVAAMAITFVACAVAFVGSAQAADAPSLQAYSGTLKGIAESGKVRIGYR